MPFRPDSLAAERAAIEEEFRLLVEEHEEFEREGHSFDFAEHFEHRAKLAALRARIREYRIRMKQAWSDTEAP